MTAARKTATLLAGGGVISASAYMSYHYQRMENNFAVKRSEKPTNFSFVHDPCRNEQFHTLATSYDTCIGRDEFYLGINMLRRILMHYHAHGDVLEVGAGTGRNIQYYPAARVRRVLLTDRSDKMLAEARQKVQRTTHSEHEVQYAFRTVDAEHLDLPADAFDTVVDTFGLCSYEDPVVVLNEMARVCKGKILLLEHGRSHQWDFVTRHLDQHAEQHAANWGCVWNRDLDSILERADVDVEILSRYHFGTTYYVVCRPKGKKTETKSA